MTGPVKLFRVAAGLMAAAVIVWSGCRISHGLAPLPGTVKARVIFRNDPPDNTQGIYLSVAPEFPPQAINQMYHSPNSLPIGLDTVHAEIVLPYGHYDAICLWWYNRDTESNFADILGLPLNPENNLAPLDFTLSESEPEFSIDLYANWDTVKRDASISGTIRFGGPFPKNTQATAVAAYRFEPKDDIHYLVWLKSIDFSIGPESPHYNSAANTYDYTLPVRHGGIDYLAVFWLAEEDAMTEFTVLGVYDGQLSLEAGEHLGGIDITADWNIIPAGSGQ
ncbi:hypothetical protein JXO52_13735 [bacterium]|nr:hypothetical protein [bacterium]